MQKLIIATRKSALAMWQSEHIKALIEQNKGIEVELLGQKTKGDVILDVPLAKIGGKGLFTKELEESMLNGSAHIAVHSLKDVPVEFPAGLGLVAISQREDPRDALVSDKFASIADLPQGAKVGTTSLRRKMQLLILRPDLNIISLRGNVGTRLNKLKSGEFDAIILAFAGVKRLGLMNEIRYITPFSYDEMTPAMGQGALGIEAVKNDEILEKVEFINNEKSLIETTIERDFVTALNGGCQVPIGIHAELSGEDIEVWAIVGLPNGKEFIKDKRTIKKADFKDFGQKLASEFIAKGAKELLARAEKMVEN